MNKKDERVQCTYEPEPGTREYREYGPRCPAMIRPCKTGRCRLHQFSGTGRKRNHIVLTRDWNIWR